MMYSWATPTYLLDQMSVDQILFYYEKGLNFVELRSNLCWNVLGEAMQQSNKENGNNDRNSEELGIGDKDTPDIKRFHALYGDRVKRG